MDTSAMLLTLRDHTWNTALRFAYHPPDEDDPCFTADEIAEAVNAENVQNVRKTLQSMAALGQLDAKPPRERERDGRGRRATRYCAPQGEGECPNIPPPSPKSTDGEQFWRQRSR